MFPSILVILAAIIVLVALAVWTSRRLSAPLWVEVALVVLAFFLAQLLIIAMDNRYPIFPTHSRVVGVTGA